jgi:hypothetical protein
MTADTIKRKLAEIDTKLSKLTALFFSYHFATMKYLKDKGLADPKEFEGYLKEAKKEYKKLSDDIDFAMLMKDFWKKKGRGK